MNWFWKKKPEPLPKARIIGLTKAETAIVRLSLDYSYHRLSKHKKSGLHGIINVDKLNELRKKL